MKYKVERLFSYGWDDAGWSEDDKPMRFDSIQEARADIEETCQMTEDAVSQGDMDTPWRSDEFRIVPEDET